jgi:hypothetical protein
LESFAIKRKKGAREKIYHMKRISTVSIYSESHPKQIKSVAVSLK